jgi:hypothetical protein
MLIFGASFKDFGKDEHRASNGGSVHAAILAGGQTLLYAT